MEIPLALFLTALAIWPVIEKPLGLAERQRFADWMAYNAAIMIVCGLVMWSVTTWHTTSLLLEEYSK